jgi:hypothetical protein|tara:strand:+ start:204 stop:332 length:129 start_codon:yes stop_codon:yes gene_type:complete
MPRQLKKKLIKMTNYKTLNSEEKEVFDNFYDYTDLMKEFEDK